LYGGVFRNGSIVWGMLADSYRFDHCDIIGAMPASAGMVVIKYAAAT
jgi:drug/metabolite transporter superfamily protein YnfA